MGKSSWASRTTFILAAVGSAVGLGNAWRFPGLCAKHGGGTFILVYIIAMLIVGLPLLMMEISIGRKTHQGAAGAFRSMSPRLEPLGWIATANAFVIVAYYAIVYAWVLLMIPTSLQFAGMTGDATAASQLFANTIQTTWDVTGYTIPLPMIIAFGVAWGSIYFCIRDGASSVGKIVKYTVFLPVLLLAVMAVKGLFMPGAMEGMKMLFIPDLEAFANPSLWVDAFGQSFYSMSIMMAIMFAYGSYLRKTTNLFVDCGIITFSGIAVSLLSAIVMFSTMGGVGMLDSISDSGIATAFVIYPQAIVNLTGNGVFNALFGVAFYLMLVTLAVDSAFSIVEGVSGSIAARFGFNPKKVTKAICIAAGLCSIIFITQAGLAWLDIVDHWINQVNMILIGILECVAIGWFFDLNKVYNQLERKSSPRLHMPRWWFFGCVRFICPIVLAALFVWNMVDLFVNHGGHYGYAPWAEFVGGWLLCILVFAAGFIIPAIIKKKKLPDNVDPTVWDQPDQDD